MIHLQVVPMVYKPSYNWSGTTEGFPRSTVMPAAGCGKTTQLRVMLGQLTPDNGSVVRSRESE